MLSSATCKRLAASYIFLRNFEHALQYVDDAQTHQVPADGAARERVARLLGAASAAAMITEYRAVQALVADVFDGVFAEPATGEDEISLAANVQGAADDGALIEDLRVRGFAEPEATAHRLRAVLDSRRMQAMTGAARTGVERLLRRALQAAIERSRETGSAHDIGPDQHFARFAQLADVIAGRSTYIALLNQFPQAFDKVMRMLAASRWATDYLVRHPMLLDELLDQRLLEHEPDWPSWSIAVRQQLTEANGDHERQMNLLRDAHHAQVFRLLVADLDGRLTVERLADHLSALADATLTLAIEYAWRSMARRHRDVPRFAVIGYGKLGGKELGYESDLDLIFLYDDEDPAAAEVYLLFARRLMTWLSAHTSSGKLFEIDLRLRPDGNTGLLVSPFDAFARYQRNEDGLGAWPWEHQALTRARYSAGDSGDRRTLRGRTDPDSDAAARYAKTLHRCAANARAHARRSPESDRIVRRQARPRRHGRRRIYRAISGACERARACRLGTQCRQYRFAAYGRTVAIDRHVTGARGGRRVSHLPQHSAPAAAQRSRTGARGASGSRTRSRGSHSTLELGFHTAGGSSLKNVNISMPIAIAAIMLRVVSVITAAASPATNFGLAIDRLNAPCVRNSSGVTSAIKAHTGA